MHGGSGQYSGVRGSGAASPTARGHETGGEGKRVGSVWTATDQMPTVSLSWLSLSFLERGVGVVGGVQPARDFPGCCWLRGALWGLFFIIIIFNQGLKAPEPKDVRELTRSGTQRETKDKAKAFTGCSWQPPRANTNQ